MKKILFALALLSMGVCAWAAEKDASASGELPHKNSLEAKVYRGSIVFQYYCALCHGVNGDGNGRTARLYKTKPANLIMSDKNDAYKELIIRRGGEAIGRSSFMPPWGNELTDEQIADVVAFLRSIRSPTVEVK